MQLFGGRIHGSCAADGIQDTITTQTENHFAPGIFDPDFGANGKIHFLWFHCTDYVGTVVIYGLLCRLPITTLTDIHSSIKGYRTSVGRNEAFFQMMPARIASARCALGSAVQSDPNRYGLIHTCALKGFVRAWL
jgi:hypothetical protein